MCARLLACPLCSQPGFLTLDALRAGLVSVATRPLACPVCNEVLLGIDKLTIHLFGHTISQGNIVVGGGNESAKLIEVSAANGQATIVRSAQAMPSIQSWNILNAAAAAAAAVNQAIEANGGGGSNGKSQLIEEQTERLENTGSGIYIPIDGIETFRTALKDGGNCIPINSSQNVTGDMKAPSQVIFLQNVAAQPKIFSANLIGQSTDNHEPIAPGIYQAIPTTTSTSTCIETIPMDQVCTKQECNTNKITTNEASIQSNTTTEPSNDIVDKIGKESYTQTSWSDNSEPSPPPPPPPPPLPPPPKYPPSHTDRLADLVKNAQITSSPLGSFHESFDCSKPEPPTELTNGPNIKSTRILSASEKTERCNVCGFHFPDKNILLLHKQLVHMVKDKESKMPELMKNWSCHLCTKVFKMRVNLMVHMRVAHPAFHATNGAKESGEQKEQQKEGSKEAETQANNGEPEQGYNCPTCGKNFKKEQHVTQHLKIHEGKQWECDVCSKMFTTKYFLKKHKRLHSGEMPYKCTICDKTFTFQQSYHKHRLYHKDDKPHSCNTCGRSFKELSTLHNHERIHTGEKPFACESCGKCFRQRVSYLVHRRIHTGVMPYKCTACDKSFRYKVSQRTHKCPMQPPGTVVPQTGGADQESQDTTKMKEMQSSSLQDEQSMDAPVTNEENQYVLVLKDDGQHMLKRKLDVDNTTEENINENTCKQNNENTNESSEFLRDIWNQETSNEMEYKENSSKSDELVSNVIKATNLWNETSNNKDDSQISDNSISKQFNLKQVNNEFTNGLWSETSVNAIYEKLPGKSLPNNVNELFSMVMSPLENGTSSPSSEMEHLRLSSPVNNQENSSEPADCFPPMNNNVNAVQVDNNNVEESFNESNVNLSTLQTINEDSLKELLYSIADK